MNRVWWLMAGALLLGMVTWGFAQGGMEGPNSGGDVKKSTPQSEAVERLGLALKLAQYGAKEKDPLALLTAARLLKQTQSVDGKRDKTVLTPPTAGDNKTVPATQPAGEPPAKPMNKPPLSAEDLIKQARELAGEDETFQALAKMIEAEKSRGAAGGPIRHRDQIAPGHTDVYKIEFIGAEVARVAVAGDHGSDLDVYIFDQNGVLVETKTGPGDVAFIEWTPRWTGSFEIRVVNKGPASNVYDFYTN